MTLPEFHAAMKAFQKFHGGGPNDEPSDDDFWAFVQATPERQSIH